MTSSCSDALALVTQLTQRNDALRVDYDNRQAALDRQIAQRTADRDAIAVPSRRTDAYPRPESDEIYGCDDARHSDIASNCAAKADGGYAGAYAWTGEEWTTWGFGPCRKTRGRCQIRQDYIDALASDAEARRAAVQADIDNLQRAKGVPLTLNPVPNISCCQGIGVQAQQVTFDRVTMRCSVDAPAAAAAAPPAAAPPPPPRQQCLRRCCRPAPLPRSSAGLWGLPKRRWLPLYCCAAAAAACW